MTDETRFLAEQFEGARDHLRAVAYRMLGSPAEAEDAVQEAWLRLSRSDAASIENLGGWLTTVVARVCLDMLRARKAQREEPLDMEQVTPAAKTESVADPENEALLADSVGLALLVVLDRLSPAERLAFVLHDLFDLSFEEIGEIVGRSAAAARQLASRARRRVRGTGADYGSEIRSQQKTVDAFIAALRSGDLEGLVAVLDPDVVVRIDGFGAATGVATEIRGARNWARGAITYAKVGQFSQPVLVNGSVGVLVAPRGRLFRVVQLTFDGGKISEVEIIADPARLRNLELAVLAT